MNLKRGILISLALYFITLVIGVIFTIIARINLDSPQNISTIYWVITIVTTVILTSLASLWYFNKAKRNAKEGVKLGFTFAIVGFIIDILFFLTQPNGAQLIGEYYKNPSFYIILALVVMTCVFIGSRENNHPSRKHIKVKVKPKSKSKKSSR